MTLTSTVDVTISTTNQHTTADDSQIHQGQALAGEAVLGAWARGRTRKLRLRSGSLELQSTLSSPAHKSQELCPGLHHRQQHKMEDVLSHKSPSSAYYNSSSA